MREYKDKHWDNKFEQFMLEKRARKAEANKVEAPAAQPKRNLDINRSGYNSYRNKIKPTKEERIFVNKGPSRFLKAHSTNSEENTVSQAHSSAPQIQIYDENKNAAQEPSITQNSQRASRIKISLIELLPYAFIVIGIILGILLIKGII